MHFARFLISLVIVGSAFTQTTVHAGDVLTGMFRLTRTTTDLVGAPMAEQLESIVPVEEKLRWQVFVPDSYDRNDPPGIFVYIDPRGGGAIPDQWRQTFENHNLIWISSRNNEGRPALAKQVWTAMLAWRAVDQQYALNLNRLYVAGSHDSVNAAVNVMISAPEFVGGVYVSESVYWGKDKSGLESMQRKHHVFMTGRNDKAESRVRDDVKRYEQDGIYNVKLIFEREGLRSPPEAKHIDEALSYLESR